MNVFGQKSGNFDPLPDGFAPHTKGDFFRKNLAGQWGIIRDLGGESCFFTNLSRTHFEKKRKST